VRLNVCIARSQLMKAEVMTDVPNDIRHNWLAVLCPKGTRCLVVSSKSKCLRDRNYGSHLLLDKTKAYDMGGNKQDVM
jgi:hypothetical protein